MDALRRQASKLKEQVAKQQQVVIKQFSVSGYEGSDAMVIDEVELQRHKQLEKLYRSTRSGREFQKDVIRAAEALSAAGYKHIEAGNKLSEDCCKYAIENVNDEILSKPASIYGDARKHVEKEQEDLNRLLFAQILEPLRAMIEGAPLEDARHLAQRYSKMRCKAFSGFPQECNEMQSFFGLSTRITFSPLEAEAHTAEVSKRHARVKESPIPENVTKLHAAESKMEEFKANMAVLGKEAAAALAAVESQQQRFTFQRLLAMVGGELTYHERVAAILREIESEIVTEKQQKESAPPLYQSKHKGEKIKYFLAEAMHAFHGESDKELSLAAGDYIVVRKVNLSGWSEGECRGKCGWFPSAYVEKRDRLPSSNTTTF